MYSLVAASCIATQNKAADAPSIEQLLNSDTVEISFKCHRDLDKRKVDMEKWLKIATAVDTLIKECYAYPEGKEWDELYKKVFDTVLFVHNEHSNPAGMHVDLLVSGQTLKEHRIIIHQNHEYTLTNDLDDTQIDQVLDLCHQTWWAKERTVKNWTLYYGTHCISHSLIVKIKKLSALYGPFPILSAMRASLMS